MNRSGKVFVHGRFAGMIHQSEDGYFFTYDEHYVNSPGAIPVSFTLPLRMEPYSSKTMIPFFDGLIPEGWLLDIAVRNWKLNPRDRMGLLLSVCKDCIGAVSVVAAQDQEEL